MKDAQMHNAIVAILDALPSLLGALATLAAALAAWLSSRANAKKLDHNTQMTQQVADKLEENTKLTQQIAGNTGSFPALKGNPDDKH